MITDWTSMFPPGSDEYWPELQQQIDHWEQRVSDDPGMFNQLVWGLMVATQRAKAAEADAKIQRDAKDIAITRNGELHKELHAMRQRAEAAEAKLALVDTFAQWKRNAPKGSLTFTEWLARRGDVQP